VIFKKKGPPTLCNLLFIVRLGLVAVCDSDAFELTILATRLIERGDVVRTMGIIKLMRAKALWLSSTVARSMATHPDG